MRGIRSRRYFGFTRTLRVAEKDGDRERTAEALKAVPDISQIAELLKRLFALSGPVLPMFAEIGVRVGDANHPKTSFELLAKTVPLAPSGGNDDRQVALSYGLKAGARFDGRSGEGGLTKYPLVAHGNLDARVFATTR